MSMYQSADRINKDLKNLFDSIPLNQFNINQREEIINIILRFGSVAKFRCRSNTAYDNFVNSCFKGVASFHRIKANDSSDFEVLRVKNMCEV